jgi:molybdopterin-binding protein
MDLTDTLSNNVAITITNTALLVLGKTYTLPKVVLYKQTTNNTSRSVYVTAEVNNIVTEAVEVLITVDVNYGLVATVTYDRYTNIVDGTTLNANSVTLAAGNITATIDAASAQALGYTGNTFTLNGNLLTAQTILTGI